MSLGALALAVVGGRAARAAPLDGAAVPPRLAPESLYVVEVTESAVACTRPGRKVESVRWDDPRSVEIATTDEVPRFPDVFWVLSGTEGGCVVPQGATGEGRLFERLQELPGFDVQAVIAARGAASNGRWPCRRKAPAGG